LSEKHGSIGETLRLEGLGTKKDDETRRLHRGQGLKSEV